MRHQSNQYGKKIGTSLSLFEGPMRLKIGVITFHYAVNYGAVMQAYGLTSFLRKAGHDVEIIDYRPPSARRYVLRAVVGSRWNVTAMLQDFRKYRLFMRFLQRRFDRTERAYLQSHALKTLAERYDVVITGSDQVWNTNTFGYEPAYFLDFGNAASARLVSYAPSSGSTEDWGGAAPEIKRLLERFHHLSVRDDATANLVESQTGRRPTIVLDPTFLGDFSQLIDDRPACDVPYLLVYHVQKSAAVDRWVDLLKKSLGLKVVVVGAPSAAADETHVAVAPERWLGYINGAQFVVTNSFHGTIFSLLYRRPFLVVPHRSGSMRLVDLLERAGLSERFLPTEADASALPKNLIEIDYGAVHRRLEEPLSRSRGFLEQALATACDEQHARLRRKPSHAP